MARQNVGNPKFYVDLPSYWWARGNIKGIGIYPDHMTGDTGYKPNIIGLNPTDFIDEELFEDGITYLTLELKDKIYLPDAGTDNFFLGFLGHNFLEASLLSSGIIFYNEEGDVLFEVDSSNITEICNLDGGEFQYNGWSLGQWTGGDSDGIYAISFKLTKEALTTRTILGSLCFGNVFQMPHSPDLSLTMTREYDGIREQKTRGGSTLTQIDYYKASEWAGYPAWELTLRDISNMIHWNKRETRSPSRGRRIWDLKFSYVNSDDLFAINELTNIYNPTDTDTNSSSGYSSSDFESLNNYSSDIRRSSSFLAVLMNNTIGGALPFIFQPDGNNNAPDQFAICRIDQDSFEYSQVAYNVWDISLKIRETW